MDFDLIAECTRYQKENPEGVKEMSRIRNKKAIEVPIHYIGSESSFIVKAVAEAIKILFQLRKNEKEAIKEE